MRVLGPALRRWDRRAAGRHDRYVANSSVVRDRIRTTYGMDADIIFPPTVVSDLGAREPVGPFDAGFHLLVSRLLPYKNVDQAVAAFARLPEERLLVIGHGPEEERLRRAMPDNVALVSGVSDDQLRWAYAQCAALVAPSLEDYGLTPLEAGAFGKPTLALRGGGYLDTVAEGISGLFFARPVAEDIAEAVLRSRETAWDAEAIVRHGEQFSEERFRSRLVAAAERPTLRLTRRPGPSPSAARRPRPRPARRRSRCRRRRRASSPGRPPARVGRPRSPATGRRRSAIAQPHRSPSHHASVRPTGTKKATLSRRL